MRRRSMVAAGAVLAALAMASDAEAQTRVEVGVLTCSARGSQGFIIGSSRELRCQFKRQGRDEYYQGTIDKFGIDIGSTKQAKISWAVLAPNIQPAAPLAQRHLRRRQRGGDSRSGCRRQRAGRRLASARSCCSRSACRRRKASTSRPAWRSCGCGRTESASYIRSTRIQRATSSRLMAAAAT